MSRNINMDVVAILAIAALGLGIFSFANQMVSIVSPPINQRVVGIWESTSRNTDYVPFNMTDDFLIAAGDNRVFNTQYLAVSNSNTTIALLKAGWYSIRLSTLLVSISGGSVYWVALFVDGTHWAYFDDYETSAIPDSTYHTINAELAVHSDGTTTMQIRVIASTDPDVDLSNVSDFEQLVIEYLST